MPERPTMQEVAAELGLSRLTVSSVVNGRTRERRVSPATAARVRKHLEERGYVPSRRARELRARSHDGVGIMHSGHLYSHLTEAFNRLTDALSDAPGRLEIMVVRRPGLIDGVKELLARGVSQVVWLQVGSPEAEFSAPGLFNYLRHARTVVYNYRFGEGDLDRELLRRGLHLVGIDRAAGLGTLARFIRSLGHSTVAFPDSAPSRASVDGRERIFAEAGLSVVHTCPEGLRGGSPAEMGRRMAEGLRRAMGERRVTAACFRDDEVAGHAMAALVRRGMRIPRDLTVTGFDGIEIADAFSVPLTTLRVPVARMVERVRRVLARPGKARRHRFEPELVKAGSHARARARS